MSLQITLTRRSSASLATDLLLDIRLHHPLSCEPANQSVRSPGAAPHSAEGIIEVERGLDTFASTNLDFILRSKGIDTIVLGGFLTNCCVESTMRSGYENGYKVITLSDCVAATSVEEHENAITYDYPMFSQPMTSEAFIGEL